MNHRLLLLITAVLLPSFAHAQTAQAFIGNFMKFTNNTLIPFLLGMAFLFVVINAIRFFVIGGAEAPSQEKAKALAIYGVAAFVVIVIFWGVVNLLSSSLGFTGKKMPTPDYVQQMNKNNSGTTPPNSSGSPLCQQGAMFDENNNRCSTN